MRLHPVDTKRDIIFFQRNRQIRLSTIPTSHRCRYACQTSESLTTIFGSRCAYIAVTIRISAVNFAIRSFGAEDMRINPA